VAQQRHCADDATSLGQTGNGFSSYQKFLLDAAGTLPASCSDVLRDYFTNLNSPINDLD